VTSKDDLSAVTSKDALTPLTSNDDLTAVTSKDVLTYVTSKDDLASVTSKDDLTSVTSNDDLTSVTSKDVLAYVTSKDALASVTSQDDLTSVTSKDALEPVIYKDAPETEELNYIPAETDWQTAEKPEKLTVSPSELEYLSTVLGKPERLLGMSVLEDAKECSSGHGNTPERIIVSSDDECSENVADCTGQSKDMIIKHGNGVHAKDISESRTVVALDAVEECGSRESMNKLDSISGEHGMEVVKMMTEHGVGVEGETNIGSQPDLVSVNSCKVVTDVETEINMAETQDMLESEQDSCWTGSSSTSVVNSQSGIDAESRDSSNEVSTGIGSLFCRFVIIFLQECLFFI
jgi:hypothetical protein